MKSQTLVSVVALSALLLALGASRATGSSPPTLTLRDDLKEVVQDEIWRANGPEPGRMMDYFRQAVDSGQPEAVDAVVEVLMELFARRWLDPTPFAAYQEAHCGGLSVFWQQELALWEMTAAERARAYSEVLRTGRQDHKLGLSWTSAIYRAVCEHLDALVPEIETVLEKPPRVGLGPRNAVATAELMRHAYLPLAYARSGDWQANYLNLVRDQLRNIASEPDDNPGSARNILVRSALLELVHSGNSDLVTPLKVLWRTIKDPVMERPENQRIYGILARSGVRDPEYPRPGLAARRLACAIRALGDPLFQEKNTHRKELLQDTKRRLAEAGWLRPVPEAQ